MDRVVDRALGDGFHHELRDGDALARVGVTAAGFEVDRELLVGHEASPVRQAARVVEQHPQRKASRAFVAGEIAEIGKLAQRSAEGALDRRVQIERAGFDELHDIGAKHRLRQRRAVKHAVLGQRRAGFAVLHAVGFLINEFSVVEDRHAQAGNVRRLHQARNVRVDLRRTEHTTVEACD